MTRGFFCECACHYHCHFCKELSVCAQNVHTYYISTKTLKCTKRPTSHKSFSIYVQVFFRTNFSKEDISPIVLQHKIHAAQTGRVAKMAFSILCCSALLRDFGVLLPLFINELCSMGGKFISLGNLFDGCLVFVEIHFCLPKLPATSLMAPLTLFNGTILIRQINHS